MKTLIVPTDFSATALNAANYAADMALTINADIFLLNTYTIPVSYMEIPVAVNFDTLQKDADAELKKIKDSLLARTGNKIKITSQAVDAVFLSALQEACEDLHPYAVVMGCQGSTAAEHLLFGTHAISAMKHLNWPLITVPMGCKFSAANKIGLACDFRKVVDTVPASEIKSLLNDFNAELHVLNIGKKEDFDADIVFQSGLLETMLLPLKPSYHFIDNKETDAGILDFVEKNNIDLLIVIPKRHSLFEQLLHKSHTRQFIIHSHVPIMVLHH
jgi:nucleotide-binding universal stress UspA family protein